MATWKEVWRRHQRALPRNATPQERGRATQLAAAEYSGRPVRRNPAGFDPFTLALIGGAAWLAWSALKGAGSGDPPKIDNPVPGQVYGDWEYRMFSNSSLGNPQPGMVYLQVVTPGWRNIKTGETRKA